MSQLIKFLRPKCKSDFRILISFFRRRRARGLFVTTMDTTFLLLMITACMCGSYKNNMNLPPPFKGNLAHVADGYEHLTNKELPYYTKSYGQINAGE